MTILLVEQNAKMALEIANRAYVLETGSIVMSGDAHELANNDQVRKAYLGRLKQQNRKERVPVGDTPFSFLHAARGGSKPVRHASAAFPGRVIKVVGDELQLVAERVLQLVDGGDHVHDGLVHIQDLIQRNVFHGEHLLRFRPLRSEYGSKPVSSRLQWTSMRSVMAWLMEMGFGDVVMVGIDIAVSSLICG